MSTKGRENWEKYKAGYVSTRLAEEVSTGNAGRDRWNELKKTIRFDKPESTQDVVSDSGAQKDKKFDAGQYAEDAGKLFLNGVAEGVAATGAAVENWIGKGLDKLFPGAGFEGSGLFNVLYNGRPDWKWAGENGLVGIKQDREYNQESLQKNAERIDGKVMKKAAEFGGDIAYGLGNAAPMAATAMVTGGTSAAAALTKEGLLKKGAEVVEQSGVLNSMSQAARDMLTSRDYWTSFASEVGMDYYDALDSGATEDEALRYALSSAGLNSVIEIGGGIQKIPEKPTFRTWLKSANEEGMEEIQQGVVSRLLENVVYNKGNPIASVTDENAVINPVTALGEYAGGAAVGGILSGGQQLTQRGINNAQYKRAYGTSAQDLVKESLELNPENALATKLQKKLDAGKKLTGSELRQLVEQNEIDMVDGDRATIQTAAEARLTELGETENVPQVAEAIARQAAGERITDAEKTLLEGSERARQVRQELNPENIRVGATDEEWTGQIGTARVNRAAYNRGIQENGVTGAKYNAETGKLDAIVKDDQGKIKTVPAEKAELSPLQEELFDWAADLGEAGPVLVSAYRQTQNLETYARQFHNAYEYGKAGVPIDYVNKSQAVSYLNTTQREIAYEEGAKVHQRELQGRQEKKRSGGTVDSSAQKKPTVSLRGATVGGVKYAPVNKKAMDGRQWASVGTMKAFAQATGVNVVFYESQANERGEYEGANGFYKDGTLYLDINAGRDRVATGETAILKTAAHEITHYIKEGSPEQYEVLKNFVVEKLTREKGISFDDLVTDKQRREPGLSYEEAVDEVVADACEMMLKDSKAVEQLARENRSLAERIRQWIRKWVRSLKAAMEGLTADRPESRAMMQYAQELQKIWDDALVDAARNGRGTESKTKYSYSGVRAKTANRSALQKAIEMRNQNKSNEEIRKETGWFVGMDGKWRFEINDRDMEFSADGTLRTQSADGIKTLADYIFHEKLFAAYPDLADVPVYFTDMKNGNFGFYSPGMDEIALNRELLSDREKLLDTLMHEIQHAIQKREKFTPGASKAYWNRRMEEGLDTRTAKEKREGERLQKEYDDLKASDPEFAADMEELNAMTPTVSRGAINWDTLEQVEPDPPEWEAFDRKRDLLEEKYGDRVFDWFALRDQIDMNRNKQSRMPGELYHDTAGEIEARDSSARRTLTEEERRKKAPDLGDENTVFADNTVAFYAKDAMGSKAASVKEQLKESRDTLNRLPPVTSKTVLEDIQKLSAAQRYEWAIKELKASGYRVERVDGSVITFEPKDINSGLRYLNTAGEIAAYTALPAVLKRGIVIHENPNHKGRGYGTVTYAATVEINGVRGNMAVVVRQTNGNRYDVHRIVMPDGAAFEFKKKANAVPTSAGGITDIAKASGEVNPAINTASKRSIRQTTENSQEKSSDKVQNQQRDYSYEALMSKPDMQVTTVDDTANYAAGSEARKIVIARAIAAAKKVGSTNENGNAVIHVDDMDTDVILSAKGLRHGLDRRFSINAPVTLKAGEILKNAVRINELTPKKDTIDASYVLIGAAKNMKNEPYIVQFVVNRASNEVTSVDVLHSIGAKTEPAGSLSPEVTGVPATLTGSAISISSLLDYVNRYFPDVLPESVLKHYGHDARPAGELGTNALFQQRELRLSDRAVLLWAAEKAVSERSKRWSTEDLNRFDLLVKKLKGLDEAYAELEALKEERTAQLAGRKEAELKKEERFELNQTKNRIQTQKDKIQRLEADTYRIESIPQMKELLRKSRSIVEAEASYKARREYIERREAQEEIAVTRRKVERNAKRLTEYMTTNTDKKHIPEALKKPIGELLESLDFSTKKSGRTTRADLKYIEAMQDLQAALAAQRLFDDTGEGTDLFKGYMDLPAGFESLLAVHVEKVKNALEKHPLKTGLVRAMDIDDLKELDVILSVMSRSVTRMNEMFVNRRFALVSEAAENSIDTMSELGQHQDKTGERFMLWDNTLPWYAFQRFGEGGKAVFEGLQDGWDKLAFNMKTVLDFRQGLIKDALARKWDTEKHRVELTDPDGATVTAVLTTTQLMSLHCLSKRKQALGHLLGGGIRPSAIELTDSIGDRIKKRSLNQDKQFKLTEESLAHLLGMLTPEQVKIADDMQKFMTEQGSLWGNEVTMIRFGYRGFTEQNYFPIETDAQDRQAKTGDTKDGSLYRLQNISAVKPLVKNANNALVLRGIFDVFANHTADMAKYNALVLPILDAQKWYNYKYASKNEAGQVSTRTVQRAMTKAYGGAANNYVIKYLQDLNGVKESGDRGDTLAKKMISNYKRAMVAANMRVALLQPTAYTRASAVLDYEYLAKAFADKTSTKQATEEMLQHSGIALWKSLGFFDTDVGRSIRDQIKGKSSKLENFVDKTMVPAEKGDEITWARLWRACKMEVQDKQELTGDELLKATAERFREVVYRTQVVDSTMTRSHTMRSNGTLSKMATSFMSEPTVSYNMVMESTRQTIGDAKRMGMRVAIRRNWKALGRSLQAYVMSAAVTAIVESLYDALRDPDDDEYMEKVWKAFGGEKPETAKDQVLSIIFGLNGNFAGGINPIGKVPYLRDVVSILGGYSNGRMDTEAVANLKKAIDIWDEVIRLQTGDLDKATKTTYYGNMTTYGMIYPTAKALSQLTGLPGSAAVREVATAWNTTVGTVWPALKMRTYEDKKLREAWENYGKDSGVSYAVMYRAIQDLKEFESDWDADGNAISGSLKAKYVEYIRGMGLTRAQEKAVWEAAKNSSWSDKGTPWG